MLREVKQIKARVAKDWRANKQRVSASINVSQSPFFLDWTTDDIKPAVSVPCNRYRTIAVDNPVANKRKVHAWLECVLIDFGNYPCVTKCYPEGRPAMCLI
jgi:hypothetical protein